MIQKAYPLPPFVSPQFQENKEDYTLKIGLVDIRDDEWLDCIVVDMYEFIAACPRPSMSVFVERYINLLEEHGVV
jgi:hypothetical protein